MGEVEGAIEGGITGDSATGRISGTITVGGSSAVGVGDTGGESVIGAGCVSLDGVSSAGTLGASVLGSAGESDGLSDGVVLFAVELSVGTNGSFCRIRVGGGPTLGDLGGCAGSGVVPELSPLAYENMFSWMPVMSTTPLLAEVVDAGLTLIEVIGFSSVVFEMMVQSKVASHRHSSRKYVVLSRKVCIPTM